MKMDNSITFDGKPLKALDDWRRLKPISELADTDWVDSANKGTLRKRGTRARRRALAHSPHKKRIRDEDWMPVLVKFLQMGMTTREIAYALHITPRRVNQLKRTTRGTCP
jgi:hypothetical protein